MADYLELRRQLYYAVLTVPKSLQGELGLRFVQSTGTGDRRLAKDIAAQLVSNWKVQIEQARGRDTSTLSKAIQWRRELEKAKSEDLKETITSLITDEAERLHDTTGSVDTAVQFVQVATGAKTLAEPYLSQWKTQLTLTPRTVEQYSKDALLFVQRFPFIEDVSKPKVSLWLDTLAAQGVSKDSQKRIIKGCRSFWKFVYRYGIKGMPEDPFHKVITTDKTKKKRPRETFEPQEIVTLWQMAKDRSDALLADLIAMGAYTGARIEELCNIKVNEVIEDAIKINDSKTPAGIRSIPIHSHLRPVIARLKDTSTDGYLLPGLTLDRFEDRSGAMSKRFGNLKTKAGHGRTKVFHCLRHTLITAMINAGVNEFVVQDIVGHEKKGVTGKNYVKTIKHEVKLEAIERVSYPFPELV